jgi:hypothetical protein
MHFIAVLLYFHSLVQLPVTIKREGFLANGED